MGHMTPASA